jgi:hypothetical protein
MTTSGDHEPGQVISLRPDSGSTERTNFTPPRWLSAAENHSIDRRKLVKHTQYALTGWRLPKAVLYWMWRGAVGICRELMMVPAGAGKVTDSLYAWGAAIDHEQAARVALGTPHAYRGAERHVNAKSWRKRLLAAGATIVIGIGLWLGFYQQTAGWVTLFCVIGLLDIIGRRARPKPEAPAAKPRPLIEGMPTHLLKEELYIVLEEEGYVTKTDRGYEGLITISDVILDITRHEYHVHIVTHTEIKPELLRQIERRINAPKNSIRQIIDELNSADQVLQIRTGINPLANVSELPWIPYGEVSAWDLLPLGASANPDTPYQLVFSGQHISIIGATGAAKTTVHMNNAIDRLSACRDAVQWAATLDKPDNFEAWGDVLSKTAYTVQEVDQLLDNALTEMDYRAEVLRELTAKAREQKNPSLRKREWTPDLGPALIIWFDEFPQIAEWNGTKLDDSGNKPNLLVKIERLLRVGRGLGISVNVGMQATGNTDSGSSIVTKMTTIKIVGPCAMADTVAIFGKEKRDQGYAPHLLKPAKLGGSHNDAGMAVIDGAGFGPDYVRGGAPLDVLVRSLRREAEWKAAGGPPKLETEDTEPKLYAINAVTIPAGLAAVDAALNHYSADVLSSALVVEHANTHGGNWTQSTLAGTLRKESPDVLVKAHDGRCRVKKKNLQCYHRSEVDEALQRLEGAS